MKKSDEKTTAGELTLDDFQPIPRPFRRAYVQSLKTQADPARISMEGPSPNTLATTEEIASMASIGLESLSPSHRPHANEKIPDGVDIPHHQYRCAVCKHRHRAAIEEAFVRWHNVSWITADFKLPNRNSIYRHAHAFGLFDRRRSNLRFALEHIIEEAERVRPNAPAVIDAVRAYAHIDDDGHWIEPPTTHIVLPAAAADSSPERPANRYTGENKK
jgi:hypothetical protein